MNNKSKITKISENIYFAFLAFAILKQFIVDTMVKVTWINNIIQTILFILGICVVIKILAQWKNAWSYRDITVAILTVGFIAASNFYIKHDYVWEYIILILGAKDIDYKKILKMYLIFTIPLFLLTVGASLLGIIDNLIFYRSATSDTVRYAMGFVYVTNFCAHLFFFCVAYALIRGKKIKYVEIIGITLVGVLCYVLSEGRNSTICIMLLAIVLVISKIISKKAADKDIRFLDVLLPLFMPVAALISVVLPLIYSSNNSFLSSLNSLMGQRIAMDSQAFSRYDVTFLGQDFTQTVFGGEGGVGFPKNYFYIDCSYVSVLLKMGILTFVAIMVIWFLITRKQCKERNYMDAFIMCVIALHCFIEYHLFNVSYNPFILLLFASTGTVCKAEEEITKKKKILKNCISLILFSVVVEVLAFNMQALTSVFKSYLNISEYDTRLGYAGISEYGMRESGDSPYIKIYDVDDEFESMYIKLDLYSMGSPVCQYNTDYSYVVYGIDDKSGELEAIKAVHANTSSPSSGYVRFDEKQNYHNYIVGFALDGKYQFELSTFEINGPKPFAINYIRLGVIYILLVAVYYFGIERRSAEVAPETIEVAKATNQFESTGALRTDAHRNMQAVYNKKNPLYIFTKRAFDIVASGIAIILLSPIFIGTAIAIKLEDKGPVFFVQMRAGKNLKPFKMWKFRSMYVNADAKIKEMMANSNEQTGHAFKMKNDPRITKVGKFIRKFSIDELPQLFNIFLGDMSIVGPRPILVFQMEECDDYDKQRLIVQPGLTCIWQVSGRANIKWDKWIELDLEYIEKMSIWTDIKLICKTIPCVLSGDGAY